MGYNIAANPGSVHKSIEEWSTNYQNSSIEQSHDQSMLSLITPDDSLIVVGPHRLSGSSEATFYPVGFVNGFNYSESSQVQPFKAIGSRRHIFSRTNQPIQGNISRMMVLGANMLRALYALNNPPGAITGGSNSRFAVGNNGMDSTWFVNLEDDIYRFPFGMGIIFNAPATMAGNTDGGGKNAAGAEYIEFCTVVNRQVASQSGQAMIMEQVTFMGDRVVPWDTYSSASSFEASSFINQVESALG